MPETPSIAATEAIRERRRRLTELGALDALRAERERRAVRWRTYAGGEGLHRPEPLHAEREGAAPGRWLEPDAELPADAIRCGLDADGRVVLARSAHDGDDALEHLLTPGGAEDELVIVGRDEGGDALVEVLRIARDEDGRVATVRDQDGALETYAYDDAGRLATVRTTFADASEQAFETRCDYDVEGALRGVERTAGAKRWSVWTAAEEVPPPRDVAPALARDEPALPTTPPATRDELRAVACAIGLARVADRIAEDARVAVALEPAAAADASSFVGGVPPLPAGTSWPSHAGRPLAPLARVDCATIPAQVDERELLPRDGLLVLFAAPGDAASDAACVLHIRPAAPTTRPAAPADLRLPPSLPVRPTPRLTLRERRSAAERFALDAGEATAYGRLLELVTGAPGRLHAQLLGHPRELQDDPRGERERLLFELHDDESATYLLATAEQLVAQRWAAVKLARAWS